MRGRKLIPVARLAVRALALILLTICAGVRFTEAQTISLTEEERLEQDFTDPLTTLPQLIVRDSYSPANYGTDVQTNQVIVRPIIPRLPQYSLLPFYQLVRPTFALVTVPIPRRKSYRVR